jgi:hypothetical protein
LDSWVVMDSWVVEVQGGFHASTADTLRLGTDGQFNAHQPEQSLLSVATPSAFGFLTNTPATITMQDSKLSVAEGKTLSLVGGELNLTGTSPSPGGAKLSAKFGLDGLILRVLLQQGKSFLLRRA